ncbi:UPF0481 protein At3g47200-like [Euphorbia lathyris]|uniref:UPF0481 protein At3g47200-like n=1 Tax=Euphorbia lathyris TaxID=212925 RepID=UPI003313CB5B
MSMNTREQIRSRDQISIDIKQPDEELLISIRNEMERISSSHSISKVKDNLRRTKPEAYIPDIVSIGPYHHKRPDLIIDESDKWRYMHALLNRKPNLEASLNDCVTALSEVDHRARSCYADYHSNSSDRHEFLKMMLVDGCFIIELLLKYSVRSLRRRNDRIFSTPGMLFDLRCDLILLENQIPLFVLQRLFQVIPIPKQCQFSFPDLAFRFFKNMIPGDPKLNREKFNQEAHHLLDIMCHCLLPTIPRVPKPKQPKPLPSATELRQSGIRIKRGKSENILDIKFSKGILEIPIILVHQYTESLFRNLLALEQCATDTMQTHFITSYVIFVKMLLKTRKDVELFHKREILINYDAKTDKEVDKLFDALCKEVEMEVRDFYFDGVCEQVNEYTGKSWELWRKRPNFGRFRSYRMRLVFVISMVALLLAIVGSSFSILSFFLHRSVKS